MTCLLTLLSTLKLPAHSSYCCTISPPWLRLRLLLPPLYCASELLTGGCSKHLSPVCCCPTADAHMCSSVSDVSTIASCSSIKHLQALKAKHVTLHTATASHNVKIAGVCSHFSTQKMQLQGNLPAVEWPHKASKGMACCFLKTRSC